MKSMIGLLLCLSGLSLFITGTAYAAELPPTFIMGQVQVVEDPTTSASLDQILAPSTRFIDLQGTAPNYNLTTSAYWFRIPVQNQQQVPHTFYLEIKNPTLDHVTLYVMRNGVARETIQSGDQMAARDRPYLATTLVLPFDLVANEATALYLRVQTESAALLVPFALLDERALQAEVVFGWVFHGVILGLFGALFIYNLFIFLLLRSRLYFYYILFLPIAYLGSAALGGFGPAYLYPGNTWLGNEGLGFFTGLSFTLILLMTREFLHTWEERWLDRLVQGFCVVALVQSLAPFVLPKGSSQGIDIVLIFIYPPVCILAGVIAWRQGRAEARFYIIGQAASWSSLFGFGLFIAGVLPYHFLLKESLSLGIAIDALLLSLALADRIRILQQRTVAAEEQARKNLEIRQEELERLVVERTAEIKTLQGILPICSNCKKIRDEQGAWQQLEAYISQHTDAQFSHGMCADCLQVMYPEVYRRRQARGG